MEGEIDTASRILSSFGSTFSLNVTRIGILTPVTPFGDDSMISDGCLPHEAKSRRAVANNT